MLLFFGKKKITKKN